MPEWIDAPHSTYVIIAYVLAAVTLLGLCGLSWYDARARSRELAKLTKAQLESTP